MKFPESNRNWVMTSHFPHLVAGWAGPFCRKRMDPSVAVGERIGKEQTEVLVRRAVVSGFSPRMPCQHLAPTLRISPIAGALMIVNRL